MAAYTDIIFIVGGAASNSYITGAEADSYAAFSPGMMPGWQRQRASAPLR